MTREAGAAKRNRLQLFSYYITHSVYDSIWSNTLHWRGIARHFRNDFLKCLEHNFELVLYFSKRQDSYS